MFKISGFWAVALSLGTLMTFRPATNSYAQTATQNTETKQPLNGDEPPIVVNPASKARIKIVSDMYDFGSILKSTTVVHSYVIKSVGKDTLVISKVRPTCGCTLAPLSSDHIAPGQEATIRTAFNTQKFNGKVEKQISIDSNDPINPYLKVSFTAVINDPLLTLQTDPVEADFDSVKANTDNEVKVHLTNVGKSPMDLTIVEQSNPDIKAKFMNSHLDPNAATDLVLNYRPTSSAGDFRESITIDATGVDEARVSIPIKGTIAK